MKKILTVILTLLMLASVCVPAFADSSARLDGYKSTDISAEGVIVPAGEPNIKISADITWDELVFVYKDGDKKWNPSTHSDEILAGGWDTAKKNITVKNHSNAAITAQISFEASVDGIEGTFDGNTLMELSSAEGTAFEEAPQDTVQFGISGTKITDPSGIALGTLTVSVASQSGEPVYTSVETEAELRSAIEAGTEYIKLTKGIFYTSSSSLSVSKNCTVDLNGCEISVMSMTNRALFDVNSVDYFCLKNGTVDFTEGTCRFVNPVGFKKTGSVYIENCTLNARDEIVLDNNGADVYVKNTVINYKYVTYPNRTALLVRSGSMSFSGNVTVNANEPFTKWDAGSVNVLPGTYNFDLSDYVDKTLYDITENAETGTWTVTEK